MELPIAGKGFPREKQKYISMHGYITDTRHIAVMLERPKNGRLFFLSSSGYLSSCYLESSSLVRVLVVDVIIDR